MLTEGLGSSSVRIAETTRVDASTTHAEAPPPPKVAATLSAAERAEVDALGTRAAGGDRVAAGRLERLVEAYEAREMARLSEDVYDAAEGQGTAPAGWRRVSTGPGADPAELRAFGLRPEDLSGGSADGFRAELYLPSAELRAQGAGPVLAFRGTSGAQDWEHNLRQGSGLESSYYTRAMDAARLVADRVGPNGFEITGHSLGGGLASAASVVTGAEATTFNAAGLHGDTAERYLASFGRTVPQRTDQIAAYQVDGEILTRAQEDIVPALQPSLLRGATVAASGAIVLDGAAEIVEGGAALAQDAAGAIADSAPGRWVGDRAADAADSRFGRWVGGGLSRVGDFLDRNTQNVQDAVSDGLDVLGRVRQGVDDAADAALRGQFHRWAVMAGPEAAGRQVDIAAYSRDGVTPRPDGLIGPTEDGGTGVEPVNRHLMDVVLGSMDAHIDSIAAGR